MPASYDVVVIGAGPAGAAAAIEARRYGLSAAVIDSNPRPGGQVFRAPSHPVPGSPEPGSDQAAGETLRADLEASGADLLLGHTAWFAAPGMRIGAAGSDGPRELEARALVVAAGTSERIIPVPGVTLPGVIGLAAATILLKAHAVVPSAPTVVAGVGPLVYAVAAGLLKAGGGLSAVVDLSRPADWLAALPGLASRPDLLRRGMGWMLALRRHRVPLRFGHAVTAVHGHESIEEAEVRAVDARWKPTGRAVETFPARSLAIGHGLVPATEIVRALGVPHEYRAARGGWTPQVAADRSTVVQGLYVAGDCSGISGAAAAGLAGALAGLSVARDLGALPVAGYEQAAQPIRAGLRRAERFGWRISSLMSPHVGLAEAMPPQTTVCRCEDISRATIDDAVSRGVRTLNQLKSTTRCGMGPCQGRMCGEAAAELVALACRRTRAEVGQWTARPPFRPVPLGRMMGDYSYDDIPRPIPLPS